MAYMVTDRPRMADIRSHNPKSNSHLGWEQVISLAYILGSVIFLLGNVFLFPLLGYSDLGVLLLLVGSALFLLVAVHGWLEIRNFWQTHAAKESTDKHERLLAGFTCLGAALFIISCIFQFSAIAMDNTGVSLFIAACAIYVGTAGLRILQVPGAYSPFALQLLHVTSTLFMLGALFLLLASVPKLLDFNDPGDHFKIQLFLGALSLLGSACFLLGGLINNYRAMAVLASWVHENSRAIQSLQNHWLTRPIYRGFKIKGQYSREQSYY